MMLSSGTEKKNRKRSEIFRAQRKARQIAKTRKPLLSYRKRKPWPKPHTSEVHVRPVNKEKDNLARASFGTFSSYRGLPRSLEAGVNRVSSIEGSRDKVIRIPWLSSKDEKEQRRKEKEKEHLTLARRANK